MGIVRKDAFPVRYCLRHPIKWIKGVFKDLKWAWQRATKGYSDYDRYDIDFWFLKTIVPMLREFNEKTYSHPYNMTPEEWHDIIEEMAQHFEQADKLSDDYLTGQDWEKAEEELHKGMTMFEKYLFNLWD